MARPATRALLTLALAAAACASPAGPAPSVRVVAQDLEFQPAALAGPAGRGLEVTLENRDRGIPHNLAIYTDESATRPLFVGQIGVGPSEITGTVPPLAPGRYFFRCDIHPSMTGLLDAR